MEISRLIQASFLSLVVMVTLLQVRVRCTPVTGHTAGSAESSRPRQPATSARTADSLTSLPSGGKELLNNVITGYDTGERQRAMFSSSSASSGSGLTKSSEGGQFSGQGQGHHEQPLSRRSRDIGSADRAMLLRAMENMAARGAAGATGGNSQEIPDDAFLMSFARQRVVRELRNALLRKSGPMDSGHLMRLITQDPSLALGPVAPLSKLKQMGEDSDLDTDEDSFFPQSAAAEESSDFSSEERDTNNGQTSWVGPTGAEGGLMGSSGDKRFSATRFLQKRNPNTLSINNAMMAITNMVLAEQKERLQRNRQRIRQHMLIQG